MAELSLSSCSVLYAEASKQVEHKWHSMRIPEPWRTLVFSKAVIHFVDDDGEGGGEKRSLRLKSHHVAKEGI